MGQKGALEGHPVRSASWLPKKKRLRALVAWCLGLLWETTEVPALMKISSSRIPSLYLLLGARMTLKGLGVPRR